MVTTIVGILIISAVMGILAACAKGGQTTDEKVFTPQPDNGKEIIVRGWTDAELARILDDFKGMYRGSWGQDFPMEVSPFEGTALRITFPKDLPPLHFSYLVNYLQYPKSLDLKTHTITVVGKTILTKDFPLPDPKFDGQTATYYIPADDRDYDRVYIKIGADTFENLFSTEAWSKVTDPRVPTGVDVSK